MGGRRARSVAEVAGTGLGARTGHLTRALEAGDATAAAIQTAKIIAAGDRTDDLLYYATKLRPAIDRVIARPRQLPLAERERLARSAWAQLKRKENIPDDLILTRILVRSVARAMGKRKP